ncbi:MAG: peptidylprolyl isomerase [Pseudomonadales bacterium]|jgi:homoserine O-acetyltransferase|nr:peptidylprolyl isomerase [Pseudomonadales bacterium]
MPRLSSTFLLLSLFTLGACQPEKPGPAGATAGGESAGAVAQSPEPAMAIEHSLVPLPGKEASVPVLTSKITLVMQTDAGELGIELYPDAAPHAVARFLELVRNGFYNDTPISRVVPGFVAQFGVNWRDHYRDWQYNIFDDDPTLFALERGTLAFAKAGRDTNATQVFINYVENNQLAAPQYNFTVFGKVVSGMEVVDQFVEVGDPSMGLDQGRLWQDGGNYLDSLTLKPTMILALRVAE